MTHHSLVGIYLCFGEIYILSPSSGLKNRASKLPCLLIAGLFGFLCDPEDGGFPWNRSVVVPDYMVSHPRSFLTLVLCEPNKSFCSRAVCCLWHFFPYPVSQFCSPYSCSVPPILLLQICLQRKYCLHRREYLANVDMGIYFWSIRDKIFFPCSVRYFVPVHYTYPDDGQDSLFLFITFKCLCLKSGTCAWDFMEWWV